MAHILKQSTEIKVRVGPVVAVGDAFTPVTTLSLSTADEAELLKANGAATVSLAAATFVAVASADGYYDLTLTTSHTDTVGTLTVAINDDSLCLPVRHDFQIVEEAVYANLYASGATAPATEAKQDTIDTVVDGIQTDLSNGTDGLGALKTGIDAIPTTAMRGTDSAATSAKQDTMETTLNAIPTTPMRGTDSAATSTKQDTMETTLNAAATAAALATVDGVVDAILVDTAEIGAAGAGLTEAGGTGDHLSAVPDTSGTTTLLSRLPAAFFAGITSLADWLGAMAGKQVADATAITEIKATGAGSGTFDATTDSLEAVRDNQSGGGASNYEIKGSYMLTGTTLNYVYWLEKDGQRVGTISAPSIDILDKDAASITFSSTPSIVGTNMAKGSGTFSPADNVPYEVEAKATYGGTEYVGVLPAGATAA